MGLPEVTIYIDGACLGNPGDGGWGAVLECNGISKEFNGFIPETTNNRAELTALIEALKCLKKPCKAMVYSDSQLTVNCASGEWTRKANRDLWGYFDELQRTHIVKLEWVRGHNGHPGNERAHKLAEKAARKQPIRI